MTRARASERERARSRTPAAQGAMNRRAKLGHGVRSLVLLLGATNALSPPACVCACAELLPLLLRLVGSPRSRGRRARRRRGPQSKDAIFHDGGGTGATATIILAAFFDHPLPTLIHSFLFAFHLSEPQKHAQCCLPPGERMARCHSPHP